jgi:hypothetical protein
MEMILPEELQQIVHEFAFACCFRGCEMAFQNQPAVLVQHMTLDLRVIGQ